jgi:hypothetical protein
MKGAMASTGSAVRGDQLGQQFGDTALDLVADRADVLDVLAGGIGELPVQLPPAGVDRTGVEATGRLSALGLFTDVEKDTTC